MDQAYFDRHYGTFHTFGTQFGSGEGLLKEILNKLKTFL